MRVLPFSFQFIVFSDVQHEEHHPLTNVCLFNGFYISSNQLPNHPLGRYRSKFYEYYLSNTSINNELTHSVNSSTHHQLDTCLNSFLEHQCNKNTTCMHYCQSAKTIFVEHQQTSSLDEQSSLCNTLRSMPDRKLTRYREQVLLWLKSIGALFHVPIKTDATTKVTDSLLRERLMPMTRAVFIRELTDIGHWKQEYMPDLALLYRVYTESGTKIPLNDWFEVGSTD
jgi:hypothetical protein